MTKRTTMAALPKPVKSKNPVVILKAVIKAIQEEPKRYDQYNLIELKEDGYSDETYWPSCGTVACVAGWTHILTGGRRRAPVMTRARKLLHLTDEESDELFTPTPEGVRRRRAVTPRQHANDGIRHIKRFVLKKWGKKI